MRKALSLLVVLALALAFPAAAYAHGEVESAIPEPDTTLGKSPNHLIINFTEPPTKDAVFKVIDGCGRNVIDQTAVQDRSGHIFLVKGGQPGEWDVSYKVVSATDGHVSKGSYGLTVRGKKDCSDPGEPAGNGGGDGDGGNAGGDQAAPTGGEEDDGSSFPVVPVAIGTVALLVLAFIARRATR